MPQDSAKIDVVVIASGSNGLGAVRSLHQKSLRVAVICDGPHDESLHSHIPVIKRTMNCEAVQADREQALLASLREFEPQHPVLIPTADWMITVLQTHAQYIEQHFKVCLPDPALSEILIDKAKEVKRVAEAIHVPKTLTQLPASPQAFQEQLSLPVIVKPRSHQHYVLNAKNVRLMTSQDVEAFYREFGNVLDSVLAQELIPGPDSAQWVCNCFFDSNSELVDAMTFNRLGLAPPHFGVTSYAVSAYNKDVIELSARLGKYLNYVGPAMVEFKFDERDGTYKYIELNPRIGMCNFFDTRCGVNNVYYTYRQARGEPLQKSSEMKSGLIYVDLWDDFYSRKIDGVGYSAIFRMYLKDLGKKHVFSHFVWYDPIPAFYRWIRVFKSLLKLK